MGHLVGKEAYRKLGEKIDSQNIRASWNDALYGVLKEIFSIEEADVYIKMPYAFSSLERIAQATKYEKTRLQNILETLASKGLVLDFMLGEKYNYMPSPIVVGIFEFSMMRTGNDVNSKHLAELFHLYWQGEQNLHTANFGHGEKISFMRALPHEESLSDHIEILDYESLKSYMDRIDKFALSICSCRHEKLHVGEKKCDVPLEVCASFGRGADYLIRHGLAKEVSREEMIAHNDRSKEMGLVFGAENVRNNINYICHCCGCCCNVLLGINKFHYPNIMVTSNFIAGIDGAECKGCGKCAKACPISAIVMLDETDPGAKRKKKPIVDTSICLGCGVCALKCSTGALKLGSRQKRVITPETAFERVILQSLERGTLQNQIFDIPENIAHKTMRFIIGAFLKLPPVKKALMSDTLRSRFLSAMKTGAGLQGKGAITDI